MRYLSEDEEKEVIQYMFEASKLARNSTCLKSKCGSVVVKDGIIIGKGFNSPPGDFESQRRCLEDKTKLHEKVVDKTCCIHAEQRAIVDALRHHEDEIIDSTLYFIRLNLNNKLLKAGEPYCTLCSKLALDIGIREFVLWHEKGICVYDTEEYNRLSFEYEELSQS